MGENNIRLAWPIIAIALGAALSSQAVWAQSDSSQELINRVDRLQREFVTLQRAYYQGKSSPAAHGFDQRLATRLEIRLTQLETEILKLTGRAEELQHAVGMFGSRFSKLVSDVDLRLRALEQVGKAGATDSAEPAPSVTPPPPASVDTRRPRINPAPDAPAQRHGTVTGRLSDQAAEAPGIQPTLPVDNPKQQYDRAISLMLNEQNLGVAERALTAFIERHSEHKLAGNAYYWLGETFYVRKDFRQAALTFADVYQRFPMSRKAPDSLLKLGMSVGKLGRVKEACAAFARLLTNFPGLGDTLKRRVQRQRQRHQCG